MGKNSILSLCLLLGIVKLPQLQLPVSASKIHATFSVAKKEVLLEGYKDKTIAYLYHKDEQIKILFGE